MEDSSAVKSRFRLPFRIKIEPRLSEAPRWYSLILSVGSVIVALLIGGGIIAIAGADPIRVYQHIAKSSFGSLGVFSDTMVKAIPLILVGLACLLQLICLTVLWLNPLYITYS